MAHRYIGRNIYELRKKRGWSQSDLTRKLDKKASTISSYETDSKTPSVDTIIAILQWLTLYNDGNDKDGLARTRLLLQVIKAMGL